MRQRNRKCPVCATIFTYIPGHRASNIWTCSDLCRRAYNARKAREKYWSNPEYRAAVSRRACAYVKRKRLRDPAWYQRRTDYVRAWQKIYSLPILPVGMSADVDHFPFEK